MDKLIVKMFSIFLFVCCFFVQSCSCVCSFRPDDKLEGILEHFLEEEIEALSEHSSEPTKPAPKS